MKIGNLLRLAAFLLLVLFLASPELFAGFFSLFTKNGQPAIYSQGSLFDITLNHLGIVAAATAAATFIAVGLAIIVTRPFGADPGRPVSLWSSADFREHPDRIDQFATRRE